MITKNEAGRRGKSFYVGRSNHAKNVSRVADNRPLERDLFEELHGYRVYLAAKQEPPFSAFAKNPTSGASAKQARKPIPKAPSRV